MSSKTLIFQIIRINSNIATTSNNNNVRQQHKKSYKSKWCLFITQTHQPL